MSIGLCLKGMNQPLSFTPGLRPVTISSRKPRNRWNGSEAWFECDEFWGKAHCLFPYARRGFAVFEFISCSPDRSFRASQAQTTSYSRE